MRERNYRREYDQFHGTPEQKKNRAKRNAARRESGLGVGDTREVHHVKPLSRGGSNGTKNRRIVSRDLNRSLSKKKGSK